MARLCYTVSSHSLWVTQQWPPINRPVKKIEHECLCCTKLLISRYLDKQVRLSYWSTDRLVATHRCYHLDRMAQTGIFSVCKSVALHEHKRTYFDLPFIDNIQRILCLKLANTVTEIGSRTSLNSHLVLYWISDGTRVTHIVAADYALLLFRKKQSAFVRWRLYSPGQP